MDFSAGFGDTFLVSELARDALDIDGGINKCSGAYSAGEWTGIAWGAGMAGTGLVRGGLRLELGNWKQGGKWFFREGTRGPHLHWGTGSGLQSHHLPWQARNRWRNFRNLARNGKAKSDLQNIAMTGLGSGVIAHGAAKECDCE